MDHYEEYFEVLWEYQLFKVIKYVYYLNKKETDRSLGFKHKFKQKNTHISNSKNVL